MLIILELLRGCWILSVSFLFSSALAKELSLAVPSRLRGQMGMMMLILCDKVALRKLSAVVVISIIYSKSQNLYHFIVCYRWEVMECSKDV